ncbi:MAG: sugar phosphate nucleotidyltransferase [Gammaproteobacteria bacterium]
MKVVLFCGGLGTRLREYSETIPKPLAPIGCRPIVWHLMKYYAHQGHNEFILCLGYRGELLKEYFLKYDECLSNDFVLKKGGKEIDLFAKDIDDWQMTFAETGLNSNLGQRLCAAKKYLAADDIFMANYSDGLSDLPLAPYIENFRRSNAVASFISVRPSQSFHAVCVDEAGVVSRIEPIVDADLWINGGFFIFKREIFDYMQDGEELVEAPFRRLIQEKRLIAHRYHGFWSAMDTFKDKKALDELYAKGDAPWEVWKLGQSSVAATAVVANLQAHAAVAGGVT